MALILNIETSTNTCSIALAENENLLSIKEAHNIQSHASLITLFINEVFESANKKINDLDAVAVSIGPGSYTGLRIGLSSAKGLCYALNIPLITVDTLESLAHGMVSNHFDENGLYIPLIDARRSEVYYAVFDSNLKTIENSTPLVLNLSTFNNYAKNLYVSGTGAAKTIEIVAEKQFIFLSNVNFSAKNMLKKSNYYYLVTKFANVAYTEPNYLKPFYSPKHKN